MSMRNEEARDYVKIRAYNKETDLEKVLDLERNCEVGSKKRPILVTDCLGDPLCRVRNSPLYHMLVISLSKINIYFYLMKYMFIIMSIVEVFFFTRQFLGKKIVFLSDINCINMYYD